MASTFVSCWRCLHIAILLVSWAACGCHAWRREENLKVKLWTLNSETQDISAAADRLFKEAKEGDHDAIAACQIVAQRSIPDILPRESEWAVVSHEKNLGDAAFKATPHRWPGTPQRVALTILVRESLRVDLGASAFTHVESMKNSTKNFDLLESVPSIGSIAGVRSFANALPTKAAGSVVAALEVEKTWLRSARTLGFVCTSINLQAIQVDKVTELASLVSPVGLGYALAGGMGRDDTFAVDVVMAMGSLNFRFDFSSVKDERGYLKEAGLQQLLYRAGGPEAGTFELDDPLDGVLEIPGLVCNRPYYHYMPAAPRYNSGSCALMELLKKSGSSMDIFAPAMKACYLPSDGETWPPTSSAESELPGWPERLCYLHSRASHGIDVQLMSEDAWEMHEGSPDIAVMATLNVFAPSSYCHTATRDGLKYRRQTPAMLPEQPAIFAAGEQLVLEGECPEGMRLPEADRLVQCTGNEKELLSRSTWPCRKPCAARPSVIGADLVPHSASHNVPEPASEPEAPLLDLDEFFGIKSTEEYFAGDELHFKCRFRSRLLPGQPQDYRCDEEGVWRAKTDDGQDYSGTTFFCQSFCEAPSFQDLLDRPDLQISEVPFFGSGNFMHANGDVLEFSCEATKVLVGPSYLVCKAIDGGYGELPHCVEPVCSVPDISDRPHLLQVRALPRFGAEVVQGMPGDVLMYTCDPGYYLIGEERVECNETLRGYGPLPTCGRSCGLAPKVTGTIVSNAREIREGEIVSYECADGYRTGGSVVEWGELLLYVLKCTNGGFSGSTPRCFALCRVPKAPKYGIIDIDTESLASQKHLAGQLPANYDYVDADAEVVEGQSVSFACQRNYRLFGQASSTCNASTHAFNAPVPQCFKAAFVTLEAVKAHGEAVKEASRLKFKVFPKKLLEKDRKFDKFNGYIDKRKMLLPFEGKAAPMILAMDEAYDAWVHVEVCKAKRSFFLSRSSCDSLAVSPMPLVQENAACEQCLGSIFEKAAENARTGVETTRTTWRFSLTMSPPKKADANPGASETMALEIQLAVQIF